MTTSVERGNDLEQKVMRILLREECIALMYNHYNLSQEFQLHVL